MARSSTAPGGYIGGEPPRRPYFNQLSGVWKLDDVVERQKAGLWANPLGIEDIFSTHLYTGNGTSQTITNGIDLAGEGGLVWIKSRANAYTHVLSDTENGGGKRLSTDSTAALSTTSASVDSFLSDGFSLATSTPSAPNTTGDSLASWTFRKAAKFFDVVTYSGSSSSQTINHNLGSTPGFIIVKVTNAPDSWVCYHRSLGNQYGIVLNSTGSQILRSTYWNNTSPTSTGFTVGTDGGVNQSGQNYVAYVFAHDAGGFGDDGTESVIKCGTFNDSSAGTVNLGWEPQWILYRSTAAGNSWIIFDNMRGWPASGNSQYLFANSSVAESGAAGVNPTSTGFSYPAYGAGDYIYIAIRRGPMKTPTDATKVFDVDAQAGGSFVTTSFPVDLSLLKRRTNVEPTYALSRLQGGTQYLETSSSNAEQTAGASPVIRFDSNVGVEDDFFGSESSLAYFNFRRAPGFFDVVAYTGSNSVISRSHNLGVTPEMMIIKGRSGTTRQWYVYHKDLGNNGTYDYELLLNTIDAQVANGQWLVSSRPTASTFTNNNFAGTNGSGETYIAYLFATCPGVSKCFSFTGNGTSQTINCGFAAGAKFVMIKRTDSTGNWLVADTARGIVSGNDPLLRLNATGAEITTLDWIDPDSSGFIVNQEATANANVNNATYIGLAIA